MNGLEYLIFHERDLMKINKFLELHSKVLSNKNSNGDNILMTIIRLYVYLSKEASSEIDYLYMVISLFCSRFSLDIASDKDSYFQIIENSGVKDKEHIDKLINLLNDNYLVTLEELKNKYDVSFNFSDDIINEMYSFTMDNNNRYDFTYQDVITIDSENAVCLDDAIYLEKSRDGTYTLYIHITDIPAFIPDNSYLFKEAMKREETLYLKDRIVTMYPEYISNNICSLCLNSNRNVISLVIKIDNDFSVIEDSFYIVKGKINVKNKLSYSNADEMILNPNSSKLSKMLVNLFRIAVKRKNSNKGKELYRKYENMLCNKEYHESLRLDVSPAANIVHEMMILLNFMIASYFKDRSFPFIYREVFLPDDEFIKNQLEIAKRIDNSDIDDKEFISSIKGAFMEGKYVGIPKYHKGLKLSCYSHISSPARRFADSFCEYLIYNFILNCDIGIKDIDLWNRRIEELVPYLNEKKNNNELFLRQYNYLVKKRRMSGHID